MAEDILDEINEDFDDDAMADIINDSPEDSSDETDSVRKESLIKKMPGKIKSVIKKNLQSKKNIIILIVSVILIIGLGLSGWLFFLKENLQEDQSIQKPVATQQDIKEKLARENEVIFEDIIDLEPFERIALKKTSTMRLISISLSLELIDHRYRKQVYTMEDRIRKIITGQVGEMTWLELRNPEGKIMLKYNLLKRINSIFPKATIRNIYFTTFIMQ